LRRWFSGPEGLRRTILLAVLSGVVLTLPSLANGFVLDDAHHRLALLGRSDQSRITGPGLGELFEFATGDPERARPLLARGLAPWWSDLTVKLAFFRPLSVVSHRLDYALFPDSGLAMHLHNVLLYAAAIALSGALYARLFGAVAAAGLATLLFAVDEAHGFLVGWLATRNALLAFVFGAIAILFHDRWRTRKRPLAALVSVASFTAALASAELGVCTLAYLLAYAIYLDQGPAKERALSVVPAVAVTATWVLAVRAAGYGVSGSEFYVDPGADPLRFARAVVTRVPLLLLGQWSPVPSTLATLRPDALGTMFVAAVAVVLSLVYFFLPLLRADRLARFFALGMLLSLLPVSATFPHDRNLLFAGIGGFGLLARMAFGIAEFHPRWPRLARGVVGLLLLVHLPLAALRLPLEATTTRRLGPQVFVQLPESAPLEGRSLMIVNGPLMFAAQQVAVDRALRGWSIPRTIRTLAPSFSAMHIERPDERTLVLGAGTGWLAAPLDTLVRRLDRRFSVGDRIELPEVVVEVLELTTDGRPAKIACRFARALEDPSFFWVYWSDGRYQPWKPLGERESVDLAAARIKL
jgi:hypothetical protein